MKTWTERILISSFELETVDACSFLLFKITVFTSVSCSCHFYGLFCSFLVSWLVYCAVHSV